jgi:hypothetical protein
MIDYNELLEYLSSLNREDQLVEIEKNERIVYSDEFINLIKGRIQFAAKEMAGAGYFQNIYPGEDADVLKNIQFDLREQNKRNTRLWRNMVKMNKGMNFRKYFKSNSGNSNTNHSDEEDIFDLNYCLKCGHSGEAETLCDICTIE